MGTSYPYVRVRAPDVTPTGVEQTNKNGVLEFTAEQEGTYTILIRDCDIADSGTYAIRFVDLMVKPQCTAGGKVGVRRNVYRHHKSTGSAYVAVPGQGGGPIILHVLCTGGDLSTRTCEYWRRA